MKNVLVRTILITAFLSFIFAIGCQKEKDSIISPVSDNPSGNLAKPGDDPAPVVHVAVNGQDITVTWDAVPGAESYHVSFDGASAIQAEPSCIGTSLTRTGIAPGNYTVKVKVNGSGNNGFSSTVAFTIESTPTSKEKLASPVVSADIAYSDPTSSASVSPAALDPNNKMVSVTFSGSVFKGKGTVTFTWDAVQNATGYLVNGILQTELSYTIENVESGEISISVVATGDPSKYIDSDAGTSTATVIAGIAVYKLTDGYNNDPNYLVNGTKGAKIPGPLYNFTGPISTSEYSIPLDLLATKYRGTERIYSFTVTVTNGGGTSVSSSADCIVHDKSL